MDLAKLEEGLAALPLYQYDFLETSELVFSPRIREVCRQECLFRLFLWRQRKRPAGGDGTAGR